MKNQQPSTRRRQALVVGVQILLFATRTTNAYVLSPPTLTILDRIKSMSHAAITAHSKQQRKATTLDTAKIGSLTVPSVGVGTISWSSSSCEYMIRSSRPVYIWNTVADSPLLVFFLSSSCLVVVRYQIFFPSAC